MITSEAHVSILDVNVTHVICTVNCEGHMGRGIALYLRKCIPGLYERYKHLCSLGIITVDKLWIYPSHPRQILCFPTKDKTWEDSKLEWIEANLIKLRDNYKTKGIVSVAMPPLGCGNGNLKWDEVRSLIYAILGDCDLEVHICLGKPK
ncbi:putative phosphatase [Erwinia phage vB_EamM_Simmy50]|uniref:Putative phosphatase n=1 Tax=Erwinia phage vB_EamM_Simmy50 TaxID=1815988 RepID=A0A173GDA3_9CAUD|nr:phosphatase [Erwinia phage vB_EamM_Simmy50]ANH51617.1 putative phosphatase [Erwinia phage vB_EamM_Simmy50]